jgi:hypothetical protein
MGHFKKKISGRNPWQSQAFGNFGKIGRQEGIAVDFTA